MAPNLEPLFSERTKLLKASDVRELLKYSQDPTVISFGGGLPNPEAFPLEDLKLVFEELLLEDNTPSLQYGPTNGDPLLRKALATMMAGRGIPAQADQIIVTHGAQQALELFGRVFLDPGDIAMVTQPTYLGIFTAISVYQPEYHGVPTDEEGILTDVLEEELRALAMDELRPKFLYVVPTFHNPTGVTMSLRRRRALVDLAAEYEVPIIEDDPYYDLRFDGESIPPIASLDKEGWVVYLGSFSKVLAPAFRVGYAHGPADLISKMSLAKQGVEVLLEDVRDDPFLVRRDAVVGRLVHADRGEDAQVRGLGDHGDVARVEEHAAEQLEGLLGAVGHDDVVRLGRDAAAREHRGEGLLEERVARRGAVLQGRRVVFVEELLEDDAQVLDGERLRARQPAREADDRRVLSVLQKLADIRRLEQLRALGEQRLEVGRHGDRARIGGSLPLKQSHML